MPTDTTVRPAFGNILQPGAYSTVDATALGANPLLARRPVVAVIGTSQGGQPLTPLYFRSPGQAFNLLRGGPGYDCVRQAFSGGASQVCFMRVGNSPTQSTLVLSGSTGTGLTLTSIDYGSWTTGLSVTVAANNNVTISYTDPLGFTYTENYNFGASGYTLAQMAQAINGTPTALYGFQPSNFVTAVAGAGTLPLATVSNAAMTGGTDGSTPAAQDWTNGLAALETQLVDLVVPATGTATVHAQVLAHCQNMSQPGARHERVAVIGGVLGESVATVITRVGSIRDKRIQLVYPGIQDYNNAGVLTTYDPFYAAARVAGMHAALPDEATALTHKPISVIGVETTLSTLVGGAIDQLLNAGITPIAPSSNNGYWIVDSLSTYNTDQTFRDIHKIRSADVVAVRARWSLEQAFVGGKNLVGTAEAIQVVANGVLADLQTSKLIRSYQPVVVSPGLDPTQFNVQLPVMLVDTNKYIFITIALQPSSQLSTDVGLTPDDALT